MILRKLLTGGPLSAILLLPAVTAMLGPPLMARWRVSLPQQGPAAE